MRVILIITLLLNAGTVFSQKTIIKGLISDAKGNKIEGVKIIIGNSKGDDTSNAKGEYNILSNKLERNEGGYVIKVFKLGYASTLKRHPISIGKINTIDFIIETGKNAKKYYNKTKEYNDSIGTLNKIINNLKKQNKKPITRILKNEKNFIEKGLNRYGGYMFFIRKGKVADTIKSGVLKVSETEIPMEYDSIADFWVNDYILLKKKINNYLTHKSNLHIISESFHNIDSTPIYKDFYIITKNSKKGLIKLSDLNIYIGFKYDKIKHEKGRIFFVNSGSDLQIINLDSIYLGEQQEKPGKNYSIVKNVNKTYDYFSIKSIKEGGIGLYDYNNDKILVPTSKSYKDFTFLEKTLIIVEDTNNVKGIYNINHNKFILDFKKAITEIESIKDRYDLVLIKNNNKYGLYDLINKTQILSCKYDSIDVIGDSNYFVISESSNKQKIVTSKDKQISKSYRKIIIKNSLVLYKKKDNKYFGLLNYKNGEEVLEQDYISIKAINKPIKRKRNFFDFFKRTLSKNKRNTTPYICKKSNGFFGVYYNYKKTLLEFKYDSIYEIDNYDNAIVVFKKGSKYGYTDFANYINPIFSSISQIENTDYYLVKFFGVDKKSILDLSRNKMVIENIQKYEVKGKYVSVQKIVNGKNQYFIYDLYFKKINRKSYDQVRFNKKVGFFEYKYELIDKWLLIK